MSKGHKTQKTRRVVVFAGRFTVSRSEFFDAMDYCFQNKDVLATDVLMTELSPGKFESWVEDYALYRGLHHWHPKKTGANECAIFSVDRLKHRGSKQLTKLRIKFGRTAPIHLIYAKVKHGPWFSVWHSPAHNYGLRRGIWATTIYYSTLGPLREWMRHRSMARKGAGAGGDYNVGLERPEMRKVILGSVEHWQFTQPKKSHQHEIVGLVTNMKLVEPARVLKAQKGFDHPPVLSVVETLT